MRARPRYPFVAPTLVFILASVLGPGCPAVAAAPLAVLTAPATVPVNSDLTMRFSGTVTDGDIRLLFASGPDPVIPHIAYTRTDANPPAYVPFLGIVHVIKPGTYVFCLIATGTPAGANAPVESFAFAFVTVTDAAPPSPPPNPEPPPNPSPTPYVGKLWGMMVLPDNLTVDLASLRTDPRLRSEMSARSVDFQAHQRSEDALKAPTWQANIQHFGGPPVVLWMDANRKIVQATKSMSVDDIVNDAKKIRGK